MSRVTKVTDPFSGRLERDIQVYIDEFPEVCPICNVASEGDLIFGADREDDGTGQLVFICGSNKCRTLFIAYYAVQGANWKYSSSAPKRNIARVFEDEINSTSPEFQNIYNQANAAESQGLHYISGMGYRKSLEFLIKDYLINFIGIDKTIIESKFLGNCIKDHVTNDNVKQVAERAVWLGNDESHYVRKWIDKDVSDLKKLIDLTIHWIVSEIITKKIVNEMN